MSASFRRSFRPEPNAAFEARRALEVLREQIGHDLLERSRLVVTEVVANCIQHAQTRPPHWIDAQVRVLPDKLRIEITDQGPGFDPVVAVRDPDNLAESGWGLWLVDRLTDRWGVDLTHSTRVWVEFDR